MQKKKFKPKFMQSVQIHTEVNASRAYHTQKKNYNGVFIKNYAINTKL